MNRFSIQKTLLVALVAVGGLASLGASEANAGWYGRRCVTPSYSYCNSTIYRPVTFSSYSHYSPICNYDYSYSTWSAPTLYAPVTISRPYSYGGYGCFAPAYNGYYGGFGYGGCYGLATPTSYGQCGW